jgi:hypothetical protein
VATFGRDFVRAATQPAYTQGLFTAAQQVGSAPRRRRFNEIMQRGQAALASAAPDPTVLSGIAQELSSLGYTEEASKFSEAAKQRGLQAAQRARASGLLTQAGSEEGLTREAVQSYIASGGSLEDIATARDVTNQIDEPLREKGRGRLRAMAQLELFNPQDPGTLQGYLNVADRHKVSQNEAMQILAEERGTSIERMKSKASSIGKPSYVDRGDIVDSRGLRYGLSEIRTGPNPEDITLNYEPVGHSQPFVETVNGRLNTTTPLGGAYRETAAGKTDRTIQERREQQRLDISKADIITENTNFSEMRSAGAQRLRLVEDTLTDVNDLLEIVEVIDQGGSLAPFMNNVERILGYEEKDPGKLRIVAKEILVGRIKSFGANPTEGERQYLEQLIPALENSKAVNKAILERLQERLGREQAAIRYMFSEGATLDGYVNYVNALYSADTGPDAQQTGNVVVDFNNLP